MLVLPGVSRTLRPLAPGAPALEEDMSCDTGYTALPALASNAASKPRLAASALYTASFI